MQILPLPTRRSVCLLRNATIHAALPYEHSLGIAAQPCEGAHRLVSKYVVARDQWDACGQSSVACRFTLVCSTGASPDLERDELRIRPAHPNPVCRKCKRAAAHP